MSPLRLGILGLSPGNGHPYSWSAIFNGYNPAAMEGCGFPVIPRYLEKQKFPEDAIAEAKVTHVWSQDRSIAEHIAKATMIENVVDHYTDMVGNVDGILLARDDAETHYEFAAPFLEAGLPIYIDKPLALSKADASRMFNLQRYPGQIFSCSALKYADELKLSEAEYARLGEIRHIHATVPKQWDKYIIHAIEPLLSLVPQRGTLKRTQTWHEGEVTSLAVSYSSGLQLLLTALGSASTPIGIRVFGTSGWTDLTFKDSFAAFKAALHDFVQGVIHQDVRTSPEFLLEAVDLVEYGII